MKNILKKHDISLRLLSLLLVRFLNCFYIFGG